MRESTAKILAVVWGCVMFVLTPLALFFYGLKWGGLETAYAVMGGYALVIVMGGAFIILDSRHENARAKKHKGNT